MKYYTGTGIVQVSKSMKETILAIAKYLSDQGYTLRTGLSKGMDAAFIEGSDSVSLFTYEGENTNGADAFICEETDFIKRDLKENYLTLGALTKVARQRVVRSYYELLGEDLNTPSEFLVCYDPCEGVVNYTHRLANRLGIKVYNLYDKEELKKLKEEWLKG